jgi:Domain of unknown function (DUF929)
MGQPRDQNVRSHVRKSARTTARERVAAQRKAQRRAEMRRRILAPVAAIAAVLAVVATLVAVKLTSPQAVASESPAPATVTSRVTSVPDRLLTGVGADQAVTPLLTVRRPGRPLTIGGKTAVVFVSEESCPFCAAERWPLAVALSHFGIWSNLGTTHSAVNDVYPHTATLSFRSARFTSPHLTLRTTELADSAGHPLQPQTTLDTQLIDTYDVPPYVNTAAQSGAVPFLDIGNRYILAGAQYNPQVLAGLTPVQIADQLDKPSSPVAKAIDGAASTIIAAIGQVLHDQAPTSGGASFALPQR